MAPAKKSRSANVNKRSAKFDEVSPNKDKPRQRKRKLSDMLGSEWSKEELQRFYEAYRKFGKDWKKVASVVRNRSMEMVEALFSMNRAYLSLPEGTASVVGLIAMMTDHYNVLEGSDSERESNGESSVTCKLQKRGRVKGRLSITRENPVESQSAASADGCLSLLKKRRLDGHAVGKRTPRFPISYPYKKDGKELYISSNRKDQKLEFDANDEDVAHVAALALTEASQTGGSSRVSERICKRMGHMEYLPGQSEERMRSRTEMDCNVSRGPIMVKDSPEGGFGSRSAEVSDRDSSLLVGMEGVGTVEVRKGKKYYAKKDRMDRNYHFDDNREEFSGTEGADINAAKRLIDVDYTDAKFQQPSPQSLKKRSKKLFFGDEIFALDALQTLADLSLMMPASTLESESSAPVKEENSALDITGTSNFGEAISSSCQIDKDKLSSPQLTDKGWKRKRNSPSVKLSKDGVYSQPHNCSRSVKTLAVDKEENRSLYECTSSEVISTFTTQCKVLRPVDKSSNSEKKKARIDFAVSTEQAPTTKQRSKRKMNPQRMLINKEIISSQKIIKEQPIKYSASAQGKALCLQETLSSCLSSYMVRRWCAFEWFYSAIDYPWFARKEFVDYLNHVGLGHVPRLTRVEWGVIRSSLGKPRRFSETFLHEEKEKLKQYRESVRNHYTDLRAGIGEGLPTDLSRPLTVGQRVIACHPKTREFYDGSILTVDHDKCRVQFDCSEIGVEFVMDIDCMPLNPLENMPEALKRQEVAVNKLYADAKELKVNVQSVFWRPMIYDSSKHSKSIQSYAHLSSSHQMNTWTNQTKGDVLCATSQARSASLDIINQQHAAHSQHRVVAQVHAREADIHALSELNHALDKKEALLMELRHSNNALMEQKDGDNSLKDSEPFKKHYATVLVQLKEASEEVSSALHYLGQRNTYNGNPLPCLKPPACSIDPVIPPRSVDDTYIHSLESCSIVGEVVKGSKIKAHLMVDSAMQAFSLVKEGEDAFLRIGEALNSMNKYQLASDPGISVKQTSHLANGSLVRDNGASNPPVTGQFHGDAERSEAQIPSDLITSCVATLLMIQMCAECQYPPADVAEILDSAVTNLHPCCSQNLPIYREIQMCMGRIKTQILALVPT